MFVLGARYSHTILRNAESAKHDRLVGAKYQSVKVLLDLPQQLRDEILSAVSVWGWDGGLIFALVLQVFILEHSWTSTFWVLPSKS